MVKTILVTGANKGIGLAIVEALLCEVSDSLLLLGSRDRARGQAAVEGLVAKLGQAVKGRVKLLVVDVTSECSVLAAAAAVEKEHGKLYGLVNNAGGWQAEITGTIDLNAYGVRRVCEAFIPIMEAGGRVVQVRRNSSLSLISFPQVSSGAAPSFVEKCSSEMRHFCANPDLTWRAVEERMIKPYLGIMEHLPAGERPAALLAAGLGERKEGSWGEYGLAKAAVNCYSLELAKRFPSLTITGCSPGFVETDLTSGFAKKSGKTAAEMGMITVDQVWVSSLSG